MHLLTPNAVAAKLAKSLTTLNRIRKVDPTFPEPLRLTGPRSRPVWSESTIEAWIERRRAEGGQ